MGLVLALVVSMDQNLANSVDDEDYCTRVLCHVAGIVLLTTIINASTLEFIIHWFGLTECTESEVQVIIQPYQSTCDRGV